MEGWAVEEDVVSCFLLSAVSASWGCGRASLVPELGVLVEVGVDVIGPDARD